MPRKAKKRVPTEFLQNQSERDPKHTSGHTPWVYVPSFTHHIDWDIRKMSFWSGAGSALDMFGQFQVPRYDLTPTQADFCALRNDYLTVAQGFKRAANKLSRELDVRGDGGAIDGQERLFDPKELGQPR